MDNWLKGGKMGAVRRRETNWTTVGRGGGGAGLALSNRSRNMKLQQQPQELP